MATSVSLDPFSQSFTLITPNGPVNVTIPDLDDFASYNIEICVNFGTQIGASVVLVIVLLLLTKTNKRQSSLFIINTVSLILNIIRNVLQCLYFTGPFSETYAYFGQDYSQVQTKDYAMSVTATVLTFIVLCCVEASLCLQVRVVCVTIRQLYRRFIFASSILIALMAIGFHLVYMIENAENIVRAVSQVPIEWLASTNNIVTPVSICWFCAVFVTKLGFALNQRRKLGVGQFGPMQIIFIMGCQTLIVPALFSILQYCLHTPAINSNALTAVVLFLPLSSLWASASIDQRGQASKGRSFRHEMFDKSGSGSTAPLAYRSTTKDAVSPSNTATTTQVSGSNPPSPHGGKQHIAEDLEAQGLVEKGQF